MCEDLGLIKHETITKCITSESQLNMPQYPPHEIEAIRKCFVLYVKFPKSRWKEIEKAEKNDEEGNKIYKNLKQEFMEKYMPKPDAAPHGGIEDFEALENSNFEVQKDGLFNNFDKDEMHWLDWTNQKVQ